EVPETSDTSLENWEFLDLGVTTGEATDGSGHEKRPTRWRSVASLRSRNWPVWLAGIVLLGIILLLIKYSYLDTTKPKTSHDDSPTPRSDKTGGSSGEMAREWARDREKIAQLLQEPWAKRILYESPHQDAGISKREKELNDRQILELFARLLQRPDLDLQG